jgi:saccharopine dehydrogenase (NAD+, L-lysine-forming)
VAVGDITCDVDGSLACTVCDTEPGDPVYVYDPETHRAQRGFEGPGLAVMPVGNLPCELPKGASVSFSGALAPFVPDLARVDLLSRFEDAEIPPPIRRSVILWQGEFTPRFEYMREFLR